MFLFFLIFFLDSNGLGLDIKGMAWHSMAWARDTSLTTHRHKAASVE